MKLLKKIFFCALMIGCLSPAFAQKQRSVTLKNGSKYFGTVISNTNGKVKLMGYDLNTYVFDTSEIIDMTYGKALKRPTERLEYGTMHDLSFQLSNAIYLGDLYPAGVKFSYAFEKVMKRHSLGADFILFINDDFAPTLGIKYRYELLKKASTPFVQIGAGNYAGLFWSSGWGNRVNASIGYQWGRAGFKRNYLIFDVTRTAGRYYGAKGQKVTYPEIYYSIGFGFRL